MGGSGGSEVVKHMVRSVTLAKVEHQSEFFGSLLSSAYLKFIVKMIPWLKWRSQNAMIPCFPLLTEQFEVQTDVASQSEFTQILLLSRFAETSEGSGY